MHVVNIAMCLCCAQNGETTIGSEGREPLTDISK